MKERKEINMAPLKQPPTLQKLAVGSFGRLFCSLCQRALKSGKTGKQLHGEAARLKEFLELYVHGYVANEVVADALVGLKGLVDNLVAKDSGGELGERAEVAYSNRKPKELEILQVMTRAMMMRHIQEVSLDAIPPLLWPVFIGHIGDMTSLVTLRIPHPRTRRFDPCRFPLLPQLNYLHALQVVCIPGQAFDNYLYPICKNCPQLTQLDVRWSRVTDQAVPHLSKCGSLQALSLRGTRITSNGLASLLKALPGIRMLDNCLFPGNALEMCTTPLGLTHAELEDVSAASLEQLVLKCSNLTFVELIPMELVPETIEPLSHLANLNHLVLGRMDFAADGVRKLLQSVGPRLKSLCLKGMREFNGAALATLWENCVLLQELSLVTCQMDESDTDDPLGNLPPLQHLKRLNCKSYLSAATQASILKRTPSLRYLTLLHPTEPVVVAAAEGGQLGCLQEFFAPTNSHLTLRLAWSLLENCPGLRRIGCLRDWGRVTSVQLVRFQVQVHMKNWDLELCSKPLPLELDGFGR